MNASNKRAHILVVDDDQDIRETMMEILEESGFDVSGASDGRQALQLLSTDRPAPDLILLDLMMPNMNGFQFREEQLKNPAHASIPVAVLTADGGAREKSEKINASGFLRKPLKIQPLLDLVNRILEARRPA
jgi:two-component system response regulator MprA